MSSHGDEYGRRWTVSDEELRGMTPEKARDLMVACFYEAQAEMFERTRVKLRLPPDEEQIRKTVEGVVRRAFEESGYDYRRPVRDAFRPVAERLERESAAYGTPADVIEHHTAEYEKVLAALERTADTAA
jgi:hypothetical protein